MKENSEKRIGILFAIGLLAGLTIAGFTLGRPEIPIQYFGFLFTIYAVWRGTIHFRDYHRLERRKTAMLESVRIRQDLSISIKELNRVFHYCTRGKSTLSVDDIHEAICKKDDKGELLINEKKPKQLVLDTDGPGGITRQAIIDLLSGYEYLAVGIKHQVFDEKIIKDFSRGGIIKAYHVFKDYIEHYNLEMAPERDGRIWENLVAMAGTFDSEDRPEIPKREKTG